MSNNYPEYALVPYSSQALEISTPSHAIALVPHGNASLVPFYAMPEQLNSCDFDYYSELSPSRQRIYQLVATAHNITPADVFDPTSLVRGEPKQKTAYQNNATGRANSPSLLRFSCWI